MTKKKQKFSNQEVANFFENNTNSSKLVDGKIIISSKKNGKIIRSIGLATARSFLESTKA